MTHRSDLWRRWSLRLTLVIFSFHFLFISSFHNTFLHAHTATGFHQHPAYPSFSPTSTPSSTRVNAVELRVQIQGTKNAYTTIRSGDVISFKLLKPTPEGQTIRLGVLSADGDILPLASMDKDSSEFSVDPSAAPMKAEQLKKEGRLGRMYSSDRRGEVITIDEYLDGEIYLPLLSEIAAYGSEERTDDEIALLEKQLDIARLEAKILERKKQQTEQGRLSKRGETRAILSDNAPKPIGPYSQAVVLNDQVYVSGCIGIDPATGKLAEGGIEAETLRSLANLEAILAAAHSGTDRIAKTTIYVTDLGQYATVNKLYATFLEKVAVDKKIVLPARTTVQVSALPLGALVEIDAVAGIASST